MVLPKGSVCRCHVKVYVKLMIIGQFHQLFVQFFQVFQVYWGSIHGNAEFHLNIVECLQNIRLKCDDNKMTTSVYIRELDKFSLMLKVTVKMSDCLVTISPIQLLEGIYSSRKPTAFKGEDYWWIPILKELCPFYAPFSFFRE